MTIVEPTKAENVYAIKPGMELPAPSASRTRPVATATPVGHRNVVSRLCNDALRHAMSGPIPMSRSSGSARNSATPASTKLSIRLMRAVNP